VFIVFFVVKELEIVFLQYVNTAAHQNPITIAGKLETCDCTIAGENCPSWTCKNKALNISSEQHVVIVLTIGTRTML
jgi:hypothetical protein